MPCSARPNIFGQSGNDSMHGEAGNDTLTGNVGDDQLDGGAGDDLLIGGDGDDQLYGGDGADRLVAGAGDDQLDGGKGDDLAYGGAGDDQLSGGDGNDLLAAGAGDDELMGGAGTDKLFGEAGDDELFGGAGADTLSGGAGDDELSGGQGNDLFLFNGGGGNDVIMDLEQQHGFIAFVPRPQPAHPDEVFYLEVVMEDESCAFLPLKFSDGDRQMMLRQILGAVNEGDPAIDRIVATHLGPLVAALSSDVTTQVATVTASFGSAVESPVLSIVIPLQQGWSDFDINLARFATESDFRAVEVVAVAPRATGDAIAQALRQYASFYEVSVTLVLSDAPLDYHEALQAGARVARADKLLFLSSAVFPRARGWLGRLLMELQRVPDAGAISPTLLYEDE